MFNNKATVQTTSDSIKPDLFVEPRQNNAISNYFEILFYVFIYLFYLFISVNAFKAMLKKQKKY